jgi:hypothetical protein
MSNATAAMRTQLVRQVAHWTNAAARLENLEDLASVSAWNGLERYLGMSIRRHFSAILQRLNRQGVLLRAALDAAASAAEFAGVRRLLLAFKQLYLRTETTLDFFADAVNTRTNPTIAGLLRACDTLADRSMAQLLDQLGKPAPVVLTYLDKGLGASILKAGLRLWDGTGENPVAAVKIARHNLHRPTAIIHEAGHQVAHIVGWNDELADALRSGLASAPDGTAEIWAGWSSEIAADAFAFVHTGYASVAALHDVIAGNEAAVLRHIPGDPHPISYLRVLLGVEMCRQFYGAGPWDDLALAWTAQYPFQKAGVGTSALLQASLPLLPEVVNLTLRSSVKGFGRRPLVALVDPARVSPAALDEVERRLGPALYTSMHWIWTESLRLLALSGFRAATATERAVELVKQQESWMLRLGGALQAA